MPVVIYGLDAGNNRVETMTTEQILTAIAVAQEGMPVIDYNNAFIAKIKEINHGNQLRFWIGTQAEYNAITSPDVNVLYIISDDNSKEQILTAIANLAASLDGIDTALANKQDVLTFDTTPTQNSTNPVTSGGIYTAIHSVITRETLWQSASTPAGDELVRPNQSVTLSKSITNYDYLEFVLTSYAGQTGINRFVATNNSHYVLMYHDIYLNEGFETYRDSKVDLLINNNNVSVYAALAINTRFNGSGLWSPTTSEVSFAIISKIVGVKVI